MKKLCVISFIALLLSLSSCATLPVGFSSSDRAVVTHDLSGVAFRQSIEIMERYNITTFDANGYDIGVHYQSNRELPVIITEYIYPSVWQGEIVPLKKHFADVSEEIVKHHANAVLVDQKELFSPNGMFGKYQYIDRFVKDNQKVNSTVYLFSENNWFIKIRATYLESDEEKAFKVVENFIDSIQYPTKSFLSE